MAVIFVSSMMLICCFSTSGSAQILPEADVECEDSVMLDISPDSVKQAIVNCELTNPTSGSESIEISYQSGNLNVAGPGSMTVEGGESVDFQIAVASSGEIPAGMYDINVSVVVTEWNGVPVSVFGFSDEDVVEVEILPYTVCSSSGPSAIFSEAGDDVLLSVVYSCDSNEESSLEVSLHLLEEGSIQETMWPSGFNDMSVDTCRVENPMGSVNCDFVLTTPSNLQSKWEGCLIVVDEMTDPIWSCSSEFAFSLTVNEKETVVPSVGIDVNGTFLEELGVTEENQNLVIGGAAGGLILVASLYAFFRRKV
ncbi:MAG TPA: hypothetical protein D7H77_01345 [Candidatus Poseidoniales archaeon]|jgi:hypothetical protein|nr:MAG TPA: hypothetical protein D7H77_01345 [Candidatus Poseidoniales archaeon]HIH67009.1 hypothetical protein [Candidatus Thalassarchaeaceae archaeon]|tara:strand:+ start:3593 stop:4522 length:930 start_codon:yes stop_codon:yes gene_type:complete